MQTLKEIYEYREMITSLVRKDLRGRYKGSVLGFLWTFINPLCQLIVYTVVFSTVLPNNDVPAFYHFLFVALVPWIFFQSSVQGGAGIIRANSNLVAKIYFPREVLPISYVTSCFVNMLLTFIIVFLSLIFTVCVNSGGVIKIKPLAILCLPAIMIIEYFMALGMSFIFSAITVYFRDMEHILGVILMAWMYMSPIFFSAETLPSKSAKILEPVFAINPMASIITAYRDILYYGNVPNYKTLITAVGFAFVVFFIGAFVFGKLKTHFAEEM